MTSTSNTGRSKQPWTTLTVSVVATVALAGCVFETESVSEPSARRMRAAFTAAILSEEAYAPDRLDAFAETADVQIVGTLGRVVAGPSLVVTTSMQPPGSAGQGSTIMEPTVIFEVDTPDGPAHILQPWSAAFDLSVLASTAPVGANVIVFASSVMPQPDTKYVGPFSSEREFSTLLEPVHPAAFFVVEDGIAHPVFSDSNVPGTAENLSIIQRLDPTVTGFA